jgi:hypothetical protein
MDLLLDRKQVGSSAFLLTADGRLSYARVSIVPAVPASRKSDE